MPAYTGPIRAEPLPIELHNTLFADGGRVVDGLADRTARSSPRSATGSP